MVEKRSLKKKMSDYPLEIMPIPKGTLNLPF